MDVNPIKSYWLQVVEKIVKTNELFGGCERFVNRVSRKL